VLRMLQHQQQERQGDVLELQPLQDSNNHDDDESSVSLETRLGLDQPLHFVDADDEFTAASLMRNVNGYLSVSLAPIDNAATATAPSPRDVSRQQELQLWRYENLAIPLCYLTVGWMQGILRPVLNVYPLDLGASEAQQTTLANIATLPSTLKIVFGFLSDTVPIAGYRRKPYLLIGWLLASFSMAALLLSTDLTIPAVAEDSNDTPSMQWLMGVFFVAGCGIWLADVMADSLVAQKARYEPDHQTGKMQSTCYAARFFGLMVAAPLSTFLYSRYQGPTVAVWILMVTPLVLVLPFVFVLCEERNMSIPPVVDQCCEIWNTVCSRAVWQPMGFVYLFNLLQVPNAAWRQYLRTVLGFTAQELNMLLVLAYALLFVGVIAYKVFFLQVSWRRIYLVCILANAIASGLQLALIRGYTAGLSPFFFCLGDDALADFIIGVQVLPVAIMMVGLCPTGSEGASYAMFTTCWNSAMMLASAMGSSWLLELWDVSKETMAKGNLDGLLRLSVLTTLMHVFPIVFLFLLPHGKHAVDALTADSRFRTSKVGGLVFLSVVFASMLYIFSVAVVNIVTGGKS
jgi:BT1 family